MLLVALGLLPAGRQWEEGTILSVRLGPPMTACALTDGGQERVGQLVFVFGGGVEQPAAERHLVFQGQLFQRLAPLQGLVLPVGLQNPLKVQVHADV